MFFARPPAPYSSLPPAARPQNAAPPPTSRKSHPLQPLTQKISAAMPKSMRPVVKLEDGEAKGQEAEGMQEEAGAGRAVQRRRVGEAGDADEARLLWLNMEAQAQAIQGLEQARVLGEELLQAKARVAELAAELKMRDEALRSIIQSKDAVIQSKDDQLQSKDAVLQAQGREMHSKDALLQAKDLLLQAQDSELRLLHADIARLNAGCAAGGAARLPAPAPHAHVDAAAQGEALFQEGQRLYGEHRFSKAAERWGRAALLRHAPSHAHLSEMLILGRRGVDKDERRVFALAAAGAALGCAHSKGALGLCYVMGYGVSEDEARGLALGRESAAAGSCFGQFVVGVCYRYGCGGVVRDYAEAVRLFRLAADQGRAGAHYNLGYMFENGLGVAQDRAEAIRFYRLSAAKGYAFAQSSLKRLGA
jgi:TPR repeat protein